MSGLLKETQWRQMDLLSSLEWEKACWDTIEVELSHTGSRFRLAGSTHAAHPIQLWLALSVLSVPVCSCPCVCMCVSGSAD